MEVKTTANRPGYGPVGSSPTLSAICPACGEEAIIRNRVKTSPDKTGDIIFDTIYSCDSCNLRIGYGMRVTPEYLERYVK